MNYICEITRWMKTYSPSIVLETAIVNVTHKINIWGLNYVKGPGNQVLGFSIVLGLDFEPCAPGRGTYRSARCLLVRSLSAMDCQGKGSLQ